ncbi:MAG: hypothetical protein WCM76_12030 [Bacteroidota bacterium]
MNKISGLKISEAEYDLPNNKGKGKIAVLMYNGGADPKKVLDFAVSVYVQNNGFHELIDAHLDNPWMRVLLSDINNLTQRGFDADEDRLTNSVK